MAHLAGQRPSGAVATAAGPPERRDAQGTLQVVSAGREWTFRSAPTGIVIGRQSDADVQIADDRVSRHHAVIELRDDGWFVTDLRSTNGTFVNGHPSPSRALTSTPTVINLGAPDGPALTLTVGAPQTGTGPAASVRIGRAVDNDVVVDDILASRHHCELQAGDDGWELVDAGSHNGTFVNGRAVRRIALEPLDVVAIGQHFFRFIDGRLEEYGDRGGISLEARHVTVRSGTGAMLVDDVTFSLGECAFLGIVGPSGCGKSTLLNAITGFRPADRGQVLYRPPLGRGGPVRSLLLLGSRSD